MVRRIYNPHASTAVLLSQDRRQTAVEASMAGVPWKEGYGEDGGPRPSLSSPLAEADRALLVEASHLLPACLPPPSSAQPGS